MKKPQWTPQFKQIVNHLGLIPKGLRTRFAPAPTGHLHLGHVASALYVWGIAKYCQAEIYLRIEDHDQGRSRIEFEQSILDDLAWLGLEPDDGVKQSSLPSRMRQSDCHKVYESYLSSLQGQHLVYSCRCSRKSIQARMPSFADESFYPGFCTPAAADRKPLDPKATWRLHLPMTAVIFEDLAAGLQSQVPWQQCGDLVLKDRSGHWSYHFTSVVDDIEQGIGLTIRGLDILPSVARQLQLRSMLGCSQTMLYLHHPLILDRQGQKLAKRSRSMNLRQWRSQGHRREDVIGQAAYQAGMIESFVPLNLKQLIEMFYE